MADPTITAMIVALSALSLIVLLTALRETVAESGWDSAALLGAFSVMLFSTAYLAVTYSGAWVSVTRQNQDIWLLPRWGRYTIMLVGIALITVSAVILFRAVRRRSKVYNVAAVLLLAAGIVSCVSTVLNGDDPFRPEVAVLLAVVAACTVAPRGLGVHVGIGTCCVMVAIVSGFAIAVHKDFSVMQCVSDKCGILGFNFRGSFHHENAFAMFLTLALPFVYIGFATWKGPVLSAYVLALILITGSRSATATAVLTFVVLMLVRPNIRRAAWAPWRTCFVYLVLAVAFIVGLALPYMTNDPSFLTSRGHLWILARDQLSDPAALLYGKGMWGWQHVRDAGLIHISSGYSLHNQWLDVLYATGLIGLVLLVGALALVVRQAGRTYSLVAGCVLLPLLLLSVTERPFSIDTADWVMWVVPGVLLSYPVGERISARQTRQTNAPEQDPRADTAS